MDGPSDDLRVEMDVKVEDSDIEATTQQYNNLLGSQSLQQSSLTNNPEVRYREINMLIKNFPLDITKGPCVPLNKIFSSTIFNEIGSIGSLYLQEL